MYTQKISNKVKNLEEKEILFYIPFSGFYYSVYDSIVDDILDSELHEGYLSEDEINNINYSNLNLQMSEHIFDVIIENIIDELEMPIETDAIIFDGLYSPKYYNFETDKIKAKVSSNVYLAILNKMENDINFINYVNENSKSRSGFVSFYNGFDEVKKEPAIFLQYLFQYFYFDFYRDEITYKTTEDLTEIIYNNI